MRECVFVCVREREPLTGAGTHKRTLHHLWEIRMRLTNYNVRVRAHQHKCAHACIHPYVHVHMRTCLRVRTRARVRASLHPSVLCVYVWVRVCACACVRVCM